MFYNKKLFDPQPMFQDFRSDEEKREGYAGDRRDGKVYLYSDPLVLAINVALATGRPLLLSGTPGCGKSSVAYNIARVMDRRYYEKVIHSRMGAHDLLWRFDAIRRLGDAQVAAAINPRGEKKEGEEKRAQPQPYEFYYPYIVPEILWWVFNGVSAKRHGLPEGEALFFDAARDPVVYTPEKTTPHHHAVVLLDEIDKAELDVPNNLLVAMGSQQFEVEMIQRTIKLKGNGPSSGDKMPLGPEELPLIVITTNNERQLPDAFLRRCIVFEITQPEEPEELIRIANHVEGKAHGKLYEKVAEAYLRMADERKAKGGDTARVNYAEYLDAVRACKKLARESESPKFIDAILERTTWKHTDY